MLIAGFVKNSFVDYPQKISAVVFTPLCNMNCWYCHNKHILSLTGLNLIDNDYVLSYLEKRKGMLDAVVITGGEPTLQHDLVPFIQQVKSKGYLVKLDSNGTNPQLLKELVEQGLVDYIAMDVKAPLEKYGFITGSNEHLPAIKESINFLLKDTVDYEFRTTFAPSLTAEDILTLATEIKGAKRYFLQQYRPLDFQQEGIIPLNRKPHPPQLLRDTCSRVREILGVCEVRGL